MIKYFFLGLSRRFFCLANTSIDVRLVCKALAFFINIQYKFVFVRFIDKFYMIRSHNFLSDNNVASIEESFFVIFEFGLIR